MSERTSLLLSRRACLPMLAAAMSVTWGTTAQAQSGNPAFDKWVAAFRARALARGISDATYTRVMSNIKPDTAVFELNRSQPEFSEQLWQYLNRRVSDWRITTGKEKAKEYAPLLARIEKDYGVDRSVMLGLWGVEFGLRRSGRPEEPHAPGDPVAGGAGLGRAAPPRLLGAGTAQRAASSSSAAGARRTRCAAPGPAPWGTPNGCRRCGSMSASTMTATAACRRSASRTTRLPAPRNISSSAASTAAASIGATRSAASPARPAKARHAPTRHGRRPALRAPTARPSRSRVRPRNCGCRSRAGPPSCSGRISMRCVPTIRR